MFAAFGIATGVFLYFKIRFLLFRPTDLLSVGLFCIFFIRHPLSARRSLARFAVFLLFCGAGALCLHAYTADYSSGADSGRYEVSGTVVSVSEGNGYSSVMLDSLSLDGRKTGGKLRLTLSVQNVRVGDILSFEGEIKKIPLPDGSDSGELYEYCSDIRYTASASEAVIAGKSRSPFLLLNAKIRALIKEVMPGEEGGLAFALLTGNSQGIDDGLLDAVRAGGIAHIFAVSGLHIGILFSAVYLIGRLLGRWRLIPAVLLSAGYCALCAFTVSSVRALIMCSAAGALRAFGKKSDFLEGIAFAAACILLVSPAQFFAVGFRLSFGACIGLALFSGSFSRALCHLPAWLSSYLSAALAVQIFTFPILVESFGYYSVWGMLLNFFVIPALSVIFPLLIACTALSLIFPAAAPVFMACPESVFALLVWAFSSADFTFVLTGFSLGAGGTVWLISCVALSERVRMGRAMRAIAACALSALFAFCMIYKNAVFSGCRISVYSEDGSSAMLIRTPSGAVLVIDGDISVYECENFLARNYGGTLSAVIVLDEDIVDAVNTAAFLDTECIYLYEETETGLRETPIAVSRDFTVNGVRYVLESAEKLAIMAEDTVVEADFAGSAALGADFFVDESCGGLIFRLKDGIIR